MKNLQQHQAWLTDSALVIPTMTKALVLLAVVSKVVPFSEPSSQTGNKGSTYFKYVEIQDNEPVTKNNIIKHVKNG